VTPNAAGSDAPRSDGETDRARHGATVPAYDRGERGVGVRGRALVLPAVVGSREVAERIADGIDGAVAAPHDYGCGQIGADRDRTEQTFVGAATNPNVGGAVIVGLGCETIGSEGVAAAVADRGVPTREVAIQDAGGTEPCIDAGIEAGQAIAATTDREPASLGDLTVGVVPGDLAASSRREAEPLVGNVVDRVVDAGGRAVVAGTDRLGAHARAAAGRCVDGAVADRLRELLAAERRSTRTARVRREAAEFRFGEVTGTWGDRPVGEALAYGERATIDAGLAVLDAPAAFEAAASGLVAAGATGILHVTAEGVPTGHPVAPVLKLSADPETLAALPDDIDVDARSADVDGVLDRLRAVAGGEPTAAERHGLERFALARAGPSM
jgi:altronate dehydratase large subunit